jgi:hypothetical protein
MIITSDKQPPKGPKCRTRWGKAIIVRRPSVFDKHARIRNRIVTSVFVPPSCTTVVHCCSHAFQLASILQNNNSPTNLKQPSPSHGLPSTSWHLCSGTFGWNEIVRIVLTLVKRFQPSSPKKAQLHSILCRLLSISKHNRSTPCSSSKAASEALSS